MKKYIIALSALSLFIAGCKKDLIRNPLDSVVEETAFVSYENFKTYSWGLYDYFDGYGAGSAIPPVVGSQELNSDNIVSNTSLSGYFTGGKSVPANAGGATSSLSVSGWNFSYLRRVNLMLDHVNSSSMSDADKRHWRSVGLFFRALRYYDMMAAFGDVPWVEHATSDTSNAVLYGPRTSRDTVALHVLNDLVWAEENIKANGDGANTINRNCVQFL
ncbi:MAG TPA: RagB/SusD family nutrient uptake outer membrane protein, partial [Flavisolibacter sp.]|nr:RagB/SusD family nutrient uptake outer membrane protein [Flavisolibacter sp.]